MIATGNLNLSAECSKAVTGLKPAISVLCSLAVTVSTYLWEYAQVRKDDLSTLIDTGRPVSRSKSLWIRFVKEALEYGSPFAF